jgi:acyl carrier protein
MAKRKTKDVEQAINDILIEELDIERDEELVPSARLDALGAGDEELFYIAAHLEHEFEIDLPDNAENHFTTVESIYNYIRRLLRG